MPSRSLALLALLGLSRPAAAQPQTLEITQIGTGIYGAIYSEMKMDPVQSNALIIIGDDGVCVVDAHYTPSAARATIAAIRKLTNLPVRYVVTTHWHDDHIFGNQEYRNAFPGVAFVAQRHTRGPMLTEAVAHQQQLAASYGKAVPTIEARLAKGVNDSGRTLTAAERGELAMVLPVYREFLAEVKTVRVVPPTITFDRDLTLHLGQREIRVLSFGPGNTEGDAVVFLPKEKIAAVGDLVVHPIPFIYGGFPASWVTVLAAVRALGPSVIVPGHGPLMRDFAYLDHVSGLMQSMARQVGDAVGRGLTLEETRKAVDLKAFHDLLVQNDPTREDTYRSSILGSGIKAAYEEAQAARKARG